jgi:hypothetical protein
VRGCWAKVLADGQDAATDAPKILQRGDLPLRDLIGAFAGEMLANQISDRF